MPHPSTRRFVLATMGLAVAAGAAPVIPARAVGPDPKSIVVEFYRMAFEQHRVKEAFDRHVGPQYIQHNPMVPDGAEATIGFLSERFRKNPQATNAIKRVIADGDLVALHVLSTSGPGDRGRAIVDIFRVADGKIVEHWDVIQPVPETAANPNTMF
jgi:predicted SnoaL-like aldol condensation-catalyzing enzyme